MLLFSKVGQYNDLKKWKPLQKRAKLQRNSKNLLSTNERAVLVSRRITMIGHPGPRCVTSWRGTELSLGASARQSLPYSNHSMSTEHSSSKTPAIISTDSLIFPEASQNWARTLTSLKRSTLSIPNRLASIHQDSLFVQRVADAFHLPLIANERCGSWYIPPGRKGESAYFKSTDGHQGQWSFSTRRLNLQVLDVIGKSNG